MRPFKIPWLLHVPHQPFMPQTGLIRIVAVKNLCSPVCGNVGKKDKGYSVKFMILTSHVIIPKLLLLNHDSILSYVPIFICLIFVFETPHISHIYIYYKIMDAHQDQSFNSFALLVVL